MESAIRLCYRPFPRYPLLHQSKGLIANASSSSSSRLSFHYQQHHTLFNHASLCASHYFPTLNPTVAAATRSSSFPLAANCIPNRFPMPSNNSEESDAASANSNRRVLRGVTGISIVLACVVGLINFNSKMNPMFKTAYACANSLAAGKTAVKSLLKTFSTPKPDSPAKRPKLNGELSGEQVDELKLYAVGLSKSGKLSQAVNELQEIIRRAEKEEKEIKKERFDKLDLKLALVELLILQEKFNEARQQLDETINKFIKDDCDAVKYPYNMKMMDKLLSIFRNYKYQLYKYKIARMVLYKFIIHAMLEDKESVKWLKSFGEILEEDEYFES